MKKILEMALTCVLLVVAVVAVPYEVNAANTTYYVDAVNGNDGNNGTSLSSAWKTLAKVNGTTFGPGDQILLQRGQTFDGMCWPKGSGVNGSPIVLGAYGTGNRPLISAGGNEAAIKLFNQQYWEIESIETTGGNPRGIAVQNSTGNILNYFRVTNCVVHDVGGTDTEKIPGDVGKKQGLIVFWADYGSVGSHFNDVVIDGCTAYSTQRWAGIEVYTNGSGEDLGASTDITIKNCTVTDTYGDGIFVFVGKDWVVLENNVVYNVGNAPREVLGTPNGIWTWRVKNSVVRYNEVYEVHSPEVDGGAFDIDYFSTNSWVEYNYAHDCDGYGAAVFGATDMSANSAYTGVTKNATVRYNVFSNNGRKAGHKGAGQGEFYVCTWSGGTLDEVKIYNNTSYWNPASNEAATHIPETLYSGSGNNVFKNNLIYSTASKLMDVNDHGLIFDNNLYWYNGSGAPNFGYNGVSYASFSSYQNGSRQDAHSVYADPLLASGTYHGTGFPVTQFTLQANSPAINAGSHIENVSVDFLGNATPVNGIYDIGACEFQGAVLPRNLAANPGFESDGNETSTPLDWSVWSSSGAETTSYIQNDGKAHSGNYHLTHYLGETGSFDVYTYQTLHNLENGTYTLKAWVRKSGNGFVYAQMEAKDFNVSGTKHMENIPTSATYQQIVIPGIEVQNGSCTIGFYTQVQNGSNYPFVYIDDVEFYKD